MNEHERYNRRLDLDCNYFELRRVINDIDYALEPLGEDIEK